MTVGREYASFVSLRAFAQALEECGRDHLEKLEMKDPQHYWNAPSRAHEAGQRFFEGFLHPGGRDLALLRAAMSHGKVCYRYRPPPDFRSIFPFCSMYARHFFMFLRAFYSSSRSVLRSKKR
jgi:hypothetical protein